MIDLGHNAEVALRIVREAKQFAFDTETTGLDWRYNAPIGYVFTAPSGSHGEALRGGESGGPVRTQPIGGDSPLPGGAPAGPLASIYVPVRHGGGGNLLGGRPMESATGPWEVHPFEQELARAFNERNQTAGMGRCIGHHIKFDAHFAGNAGIRLGRNLADTQDMGAMLDEYSRSFGLADLSTKYGVTAKLGDDLYRHLHSMFGGPSDKGAMENYWRLSGTDEYGYDYAVGDGISTYELYEIERAKISEEEMDLIWGVESDLIWTLYRMERKGMKVDKNEIDRLRHATENLITEKLRSFKPGFNVRSPKDMRETFEEIGLTDWPLTDKGNPSFTEKWLKKSERGQDIVAIRQMTNLLSSFVNPLEERHMFNGRVHATLNQLKNDDSGTISGRFSCVQPNLQQVPKRNKQQAIPFRRLFIPDEGRILWERDWSQCEPRLFAHYSGDRALLDGYNAVPFRDAHQVVADLLSVERDPTAKRMNMGIFTGMQVKTFAEHMGWPVDRASRAWSEWYEEFPGVKSFQNKAKARLKNRGYVYTLLGRRCRLEHARFAYRGTSKIIQGSNADIAKYKLLEMDKFCESVEFIVDVAMTVHDSFNGQRDDTPEAEKALGELVRIMEDVQTEPFNLRVPFIAEGTEGANWAEASFGVDAVKKYDEAA